MKKRITYLDNLRTTAIFFVIVVHAGLVYEQVLQNAWIVVDPDKADWIGLVRMYLDLFIMYTIFFISGYLVPASVKNRSAGQFFRSKAKRILIPWLVSVLTLIPLYKMIFLFSRGLPQEAWYTYFHVFQRQGSDLSLFSNNPSQNWLWFLPVLFLFQMLYLAMHRWQLLPKRLSLTAAVAIIFLVGVVSSMVISNAGLTGWQHGAFLEFQRERLLPYFMVFLLGSLCTRNRALEAPKNVKAYIAANVILTISLGMFTAVALNLFFNLVDPNRAYYFVSGFVDRTVYYMTALCSMFSFLYILLYAFRFTFNKTGQLMKSMNRNSYAVYIIHVVVLGALALVLLPWGIPAWAKYLLLVAGTFFLSNLLVSGYRRYIRHNTPLKLAGAVVFLLFFLGFTGNDRRPAPASEVSIVNAPPDTTPAPDMSLHEAVIRNDLAVISRHIRAGSDLDEREPSGGSSPLITAAMFDKTEAARLLLDAGTDVDLVNNDGSTALITAAFFGRTEIVRMLLDAGADPSIRNASGSTALDAVSAPFNSVKWIYDDYRKTFGPMGLQLDDAVLKDQRAVIAGMLGDE